MAVHLTQEEAGLCRTPMRQFLMQSPIQALIRQCPAEDPFASPSRFEDIITIWPARKLFSSPRREPSSSPTSGYSSDHDDFTTDEFYFEEIEQQLQSSWDLMPKVRSLSGSSTDSTEAVKMGQVFYNRPRKSESSLTHARIEQDQVAKKKRSMSQSPSKRQPLVLKLKLCEYGYKIVSKTSPTKMAVNIEEPKEIQVCDKSSPTLSPVLKKPNEARSTLEKSWGPFFKVNDCKSYTRTKEEGIMEFQEARAVKRKRKDDNEAKTRDDSHNRYSREKKKPKLEEKSESKRLERNYNRSDRSPMRDEQKREHSRSNLLELADRKYKSYSHSRRNKESSRSKHNERKMEDREHKSDIILRHNGKAVRRSKNDVRKREDRERKSDGHFKRHDWRSKYHERQRADNKHNFDRYFKRDMNVRRSHHHERKREDREHKSVSHFKRYERDNWRSKHQDRQWADHKHRSFSYSNRDLRNHKSYSNSKYDDKRKEHSKP
jgi:hypothetical protein